jgi:transcriptional regulator with XRE-family HTH domain
VTGTPPVRRRLLGAALRRYRENLGYALDEAARILECDRSKISRIETGQRGISAKELRELLTEYNVPRAEQEALLAVAHRGRHHGWWQEYRDVLSDVGQDYVIMESAASEILAFDAHQVPDLLQTPGYATAVAVADPACTADEQRAHAVEVKLARQRVVLGERRPRIEFVIGEAALHQVVGGAEVMRPQLARLAAVADGAVDAAVPGVSLRVLPFTAGAHAAAGAGSVTILRFADARELGVIHLAALAGGVSLEGRDEVTRYSGAFAQLRAAALTPAASARLLRAMARD